MGGGMRVGSGVASHQCTCTSSPAYRRVLALPSPVSGGLLLLCLQISFHFCPLSLFSRDLKSLLLPKSTIRLRGFVSLDRTSRGSSDSTVLRKPARIAAWPKTLFHSAAEYQTQHPVAAANSIAPTASLGIHVRGVVADRENRALLVSCDKVNLNAFTTSGTHWDSEHAPYIPD